ncbi:MAG TPA: hypothetical protein PLW78_12140 [bacterium]|jgi:hypothetical protein|nr:hypothetical protein [bacterium]
MESINFLEILDEKIVKFINSHKDPEESGLLLTMWGHLQDVMATNPSIKTASPREQYDKVIKLLMQEVAGSAGDLMRALKRDMACKGLTNFALIKAENDQRIAMTLTRKVLYVWNRAQGD